MLQRVMRPLTPKQQRFVEEYLVDLNATQAYQRAGYKAKDGPSAEAAASRLLRSVKVAAVIAERQEKRSERVEVTQDDVLRGLLGEARFKGEGSSHSARVAAWSWLGKHLGMAKDHLEVKQAGELTIIKRIIRAPSDDRPAPDAG